MSVFLAAIPAPGQATPLWTIDFDTAPVGSYLGSVDSGDFGAPYSCGGLLQVAETAGGGRVAVYDGNQAASISDMGASCAGFVLSAYLGLPFAQLDPYVWYALRFDGDAEVALKLNDHVLTDADDGRNNEIAFRPVDIFGSDINIPDACGVIPEFDPTKPDTVYPCRASMLLFVLNGDAATPAWIDNISFVALDVAEPGSLSLILGAGLAAIALTRRRRP